MKKIVVVLLFLIISNAYSQRFTILLGDFKNVKSISEYNAVFDYKDIQVNGFDSEESYLKEKTEKRKNYDGGKDLNGKAEKFEKAWFEDRENKYEPAFINYFNKMLDKEKIMVEKNPALKFTMNIKTIWIYPGYELANVEPAKISAIITISETANPSNVLLKVQFDKAIGIVKDYRKQGDRISGAYEKLAKNLIIQMKRFL